MEKNFITLLVNETLEAEQVSSPSYSLSRILDKNMYFLESKNWFFPESFFEDLLPGASCTFTDFYDLNIIFEHHSSTKYAISKSEDSSTITIKVIKESQSTTDIKSAA